MPKTFEPRAYDMLNRRRPTTDDDDDDRRPTTATTTTTNEPIEAPKALFETQCKAANKMNVRIDKVIMEARVLYRQGQARADEEFAQQEKEKGSGSARKGRRGKTEGAA